MHIHRLLQLASGEHFALRFYTFFNFIWQYAIYDTTQQKSSTTQLGVIICVLMYNFHNKKYNKLAHYAEYSVEFRRIQLRKN